ncbi:carboxylesterase family protein [Fusarium austroafricanum]|uniref:Carboxylic ester hydrolase n=1 Tax=Fusarium austroafricanum TaxID=2364996 RepID=A0A8H4KB12_9HYPO|nr:carboxylesterase family protein [Fusarium austroafricanum]
MRVPNYLLPLTAVLTAQVTAAPTSNENSTYLPVVDLGYELHRALWHNPDTDLYKFQNVRYGRSPTGDLRFRAPQSPIKNRTAVQTGAGTRICPQGQPRWQAKTLMAIGKYSSPMVPFTLEGWVEAIENGMVPPGNINANATEDCLLLDVHVPKKVLKAAGTEDKEGVPVLVFIHGGGVFGSKDGSGPTRFEPSGILAQAQSTFNQDFVFVTLNYRLGAFGWLNSAEVLADGDANVALLDQRFALQWVQDNIHLFGGSKDHVTIMGESGGGSSVLHHLIAAGADRNRLGGSCQPTKKLFQQAISQSPADVPVATSDPDELYDGFLSILKADNLEAARSMSSAAVIAANAAQIAAFPHTNYVHSPIVDSNSSFGPVIKSLQEGKFDKSVKVMAAHNIFEGGFFFDPNVKTDGDFDEWLKRSLPGLDRERRGELVEKVYPPVYDGSLGYVDMNTRQMRVWGESAIDCSFNAISQATKDKSYAYEFGVSPGFHIQDLSYTFGTTATAMRPSQKSLQLAIASFVLKGVPILEGGKEFPIFGDEGLLVNITAAGAVPSVPNNINQTRC